jgi:hypothetical protein
MQSTTTGSSGCKNYCTMVQYVPTATQHDGTQWKTQGALAATIECGTACADWTFKLDAHA